MLLAIIMPVLLLFCGLMIDLGRIHIVKNKLQTAVDAASLAAASTASLEPIISESEPIEIEGWQINFSDSALTHNEAKTYLNLNASPLYWKERGVDYQNYMTGHIIEPDLYQVEAEAFVKTIFYGPMKALFTGDTDWYTVPVRVESQSQVVVFQS